MIAEAVLGIEAERIAQFDRIGLASSALAAPRAGYAGAEAYPGFTAKAAVLTWHLVKNHPLPDGNKRSAYLCLVEFCARNGHEFHPDTVDQTASVIEGVAAGTVTEQGLERWIRERMASS